MAPCGKIEVEVAVVVGSAEVSLKRLLALGRGAVIPLGRAASEPLTITANGAPVARGRVAIDGERVVVEVISEAA